MIFQHFNLLSSRTVFDNVALPLRLEKTARSHLSKKSMRSWNWFGLNDKKTRIRQIYPAVKKQRVAIARALASDPQSVALRRSYQRIRSGNHIIYFKFIKRN